MKEERIISVSQLNAVAKILIENEPLLAGVTVRGELSGVKKYASGHMYFTLKDREAAVSCVMFAGNTYGLDFLPKDGMMVRVRGNAGIYERDGRFQFNVRSMEAEGKGGLWEAFEKLKEKLKAEGLFAEEHKKDIPKFPRRIGVVTSKNGAVFHDILDVTGRRYPLAEIVLYSAAVQGTEAPAQLAKGIRVLDETAGCDVLIIGRGGGSMEDLWCFNDEGLARAIYACKTPVISAVGHETDFTICDFVADRRAPTPSAAAEMAVPDREELRKALALLQGRIAAPVKAKIREGKKQIEIWAGSRVLSDVSAPLSVKKQQILTLGERLDTAITGRYGEKKNAVERLLPRFYPQFGREMERKREKISLLAGRMTGLNPMAVLGRGYSALFDEQGQVVKTVKALKKGQKLWVKMVDGAVKTTVEEVDEIEKVQVSGTEV